MGHCLSSTTVGTNFATHIDTARGRDIVVREGNIIGMVQDTATTRKEILDRF